MRRLFFICTFWPCLVLAQVKVVFIEMKGRDGRTLQLEEGARFSHVAISYHGQWLHTHPYRGVELVSRQRLEEMGLIAALVELADHAEPEKKFVDSILGSPYDITFSWQSDRYYCSKLVGKILGLQTEPMNFDAPGWPPQFKKYNGLPGISPQGVFTQLLRLGYQVQSPIQCERIFE